MITPSPGARRLDEPDELLDIRLHAPTPAAVIVWAAGRVTGTTAPQLALRTGQQFHRAPHVILDLSGVDHLDTDALDVLGGLPERARVAATRLHIAGVEHEALAARLRRVGFGEHLTPAPAAAVLAGLDRPGRRRGREV
ncbi:STAS domain-containing protein, partial [Pseudonocardia asaccharolytica]|uniref:STAS domain-containing protein n=1 Tax=Pseudonocardia asaccharolytica TaxID=54010 RepID=UPI0013782E4F